MGIATAFSVIGASIGFKLAWGPIYWGLISAFAGFIVGFAIRLVMELFIKKKKRVLKGKHAEIILMLNVICHKQNRSKIYFGAILH